MITIKRLIAMNNDDGHNDDDLMMLVMMTMCDHVGWIGVKNQQDQGNPSGNGRHKIF